MIKENWIAHEVSELTGAIHKKFGPGLLETVYEEVFCYELAKTGLSFTRQQPIPLVYKSLNVDIGCRAGIVVEDRVIIEIRSVESFSMLQFKQMLTYLKLSKLKLGVLINFNVVYLKDGIHLINNN